MWVQLISGTAQWSQVWNAAAVCLNFVYKKSIFSSLFFFLSPPQAVCWFLSANFIYKTYSIAETVVFDSHPSWDNRRIFIKHKAFIYCSTHMMGFILHLPKECATKIKRSFLFSSVTQFCETFWGIIYEKAMAVFYKLLFFSFQFFLLCVGFFCLKGHSWFEMTFQSECCTLQFQVMFYKS